MGFIAVCRNLELPQAGEGKDEVLTRLYQKEAEILKTYEAVNNALGVQLRGELDRRALAGEPSRSTPGGH